MNLTKHNELALINALIAKFFHCLKNKNKEEAQNLMENIKNLELKNKEAYEIQTLFIELVDLIIKKQHIYYSDLATKLNKKYGLDISTTGSALGKKLGNLLGSLSIISKINANIAISIYVINKQSNKAGKGLKNLIKTLNKLLKKEIDYKYNEDIETYKVDQLFDILRK